MHLVFIHGAADSSAVWELQVQTFGREHTVLAVDLPGHGSRLAQLAFESCERSAQDVLEQIEASSLQAPILVGHSMGGGIALTIALEHPEVPSALVLVGSGARLRIRPEVIESARQRSESSPPGVRIDRVIPLQDVVSARAGVEVRDWLGARIGQATGQATYADFLATSAFDAMARLHEIRVPTLIIGGEDDRWTPPKFQQYFAEHIVGAHLVMFTGCGHYPFAERAEAFNAELGRFFARLEAEASRGVSA